MDCFYGQVKPALCEQDHSQDFVNMYREVIKIILAGNIMNWPGLVKAQLRIGGLSNGWLRQHRTSIVHLPSITMYSIWINSNLSSNIFFYLLPSGKSPDVLVAIPLDWKAALFNSCWTQEMLVSAIRLLLLMLLEGRPALQTPSLSDLSSPETLGQQRAAPEEECNPRRAAGRSGGTIAHILHIQESQCLTQTVNS